MLLAERLARPSHAVYIITKHAIYDVCAQLPTAESHYCLDDLASLMFLDFKCLRVVRTG